MGSGVGLGLETAVLALENERLHPRVVLGALGALGAALDHLRDLLPRGGVVAGRSDLLRDFLLALAEMQRVGALRFP